MLKRCRLPLAIFLLFCAAGVAQEKTVISGSVFSEEKSTEFIHVINKSLEIGTSVDQNGDFEIPVRLNDTLFFSSIQFEKKIVKITSEILTNRKLEVFLVEIPTELDEIVISDLKLTGDLSTDMKKINVEKVEIRNNLNSELASAIELDRKLNPPDPLVEGAAVDIIQLVKLVKKVTSKPKKAEPVYKRADYLRIGVERVGEDFFKKQYEISEQEIANFVEFCLVDDHFKRIIRNGNAFDLIVYYDGRFAEFEKRRGHLLMKIKP